MLLLHVNEGAYFYRVASSVTLADVEKGGYDLTVKRYIEKKPQEVVPPEVVRRNYFEILEKVRTAEDKMQRLLLEGGYISGK